MLMFCYKKVLMKSIKILSFALGIFFLDYFLVFAYVASSTNYRIESDAVSFGGGISTSTNYSIDDSLSGGSLGSASSTLYSVKLSSVSGIGSGTISMSYPSTVSLTPSFKTNEGGQGNGDFNVSVITDNTGGYSLSIKANSSPALSSSNDSFSNYSSSVYGTPDFNWSNSASDSRFGFTPEGGDIVQKYKDNGTACNSGALDTSERCWDSIDATNKTIAESSSPNQPSGTVTRIRLRSEAGATRKQKAGNYSAEIIVTALVR